MYGANVNAASRYKYAIVIKAHKLLMVISTALLLCLLDDYHILQTHDCAVCGGMRYTSISLTFAPKPMEELWDL
jgi:hypothetical protein